MFTMHLHKVPQAQFLQSNQGSIRHEKEEEPQQRCAAQNRPRGEATLLGSRQATPNGMH